ncbi:MAG: DUF4347 domain-containing protein [Ramlibacter sp.]|nr:DUF4347 domain-containing protein [Ramlibacter sp.]
MMSSSDLSLFTGPMPVEAPVSKVLFVDGRVPDLQSIIAAAEPGVKVVVLDSDQNGVQQMARALDGMHDVASISVVSHGDQGVLLLGNGPLFAGNLGEHQGDLAAIGRALSADGDILLYGCDVGAGEQGASFVQALADMTGADVAASNNSTGASARGGDWNLEISTGSIDGAPALHVQDLSGYSYTLHTASVSTVAQLKAAIAAGNGDGLADTITLTGNITFASAADAISINVTDGQTMSIVGGGFILSGNNLTRVLDVATSGAGSAVSISNLTITNGFLTGNGGNIGDGTNGAQGGDALGAGVRNSGTLTITNSTITANKAAGGGGGGSMYGSGGGAGGGGGGFGATLGGAGGLNPPRVAGPASAGVGGTGAGFVGTTPPTAVFDLGGKGGSTTGGAGGTGTGYTSGGAGATANNGSISIGGGGGGGGYDWGGGRGGDAIAAIYNTGTITILNSSITNNIAAGGGGGGGAAVPSANNGAGGTGGAGVGVMWNVGGTAQLDAATTATLSTGNVGVGGTGGAATKGGASTPGPAGAPTSTIVSTGGGTQDTAYLGVLGVSSSTANGAYKAGDVISIQVTFTNTVTVTGTPQLTLETGTTDRTISYSGVGSGTNTLTFTYTVQAGDTSADLDYLSTSALTLNGGTIKNGATDAVLTLPSPGAAGSLGANKALVIDTTAPTTTISTIAFSADTGSSGTDFITNTAAQTISGTTSANMVAGEIVQVSLDNGATWATATTSVGSNTWSLATTLTASNTLRVRVTDTAGNSGTATSPGLRGHHGATTISTIAFSADTGSSGTDFICQHRGANHLRHHQRQHGGQEIILGVAGQRTTLGYRHQRGVQHLVTGHHTDHNLNTLRVRVTGLPPGSSAAARPARHRAGHHGAHHHHIHHCVLGGHGQFGHGLHHQHRGTISPGFPSANMVAGKSLRCRWTTEPPGPPPPPAWGPTPGRWPPH